MMRKNGVRCLFVVRSLYVLFPAFSAPHVAFASSVITDQSQAGTCHSAHNRMLASICVDLGRFYCFPSLPEAAETGSEGGREREPGGLLTSIHPLLTGLLLIPPRRGSSKFVQNLRKLTAASDCGQNATSLVTGLYMQKKASCSTTRTPSSSSMTNRARG